MESIILNIEDLSLP